VQLPVQRPLPLHVWPPWQAWAHFPQLALSVPVLAQKVFGAVPHRLGALGGHSQLPALQLWPAGQAWPHVPQFKESLWRLAQWLPPSCPGQLDWEGGQPQLPLTQASPAAQTTPHCPQFCVSEASWVQAPLHSVPPVAPQMACGLPAMHCCDTQTSPVAQSALVTHGAGVAVKVKQADKAAARASARLRGRESAVMRRPSR
jgi:hypothetical protein